MARNISDRKDRYPLEFKLGAVRLTETGNATAKSIAQSLGIHPVMLYRWRMEVRDGILREPDTMKKKSLTPKPAKPQTITTEAELLRAQKRIRELEKALSAREDEIDILKKAQRFFEVHRR